MRVLFGLALWSVSVLARTDKCFPTPLGQRMCRTGVDLSERFGSCRLAILRSGKSAIDVSTPGFPTCEAKSSLRSLPERKGRYSQSTELYAERDALVTKSGRK
jgi:hypothetical protein